MNKSLAELATEEIEKEARKRAKEINFDIQKEPHGLARMIASVLADKDYSLSVLRKYIKLKREELRNEN